MRRYGFMALFLLAAFAVAATMFTPKATLAETPAPIQRTLDVTGTGKLTVKPDTAEITLGVSELKSAATDAYSAMSTSMDQIVATLKKSGVKEEEIKTGSFSIYAEYDWTKEGGQSLKGWRATNTLIVTTTKLDQVAALIQATVAAGSNQIQGVRFYVKNTDALLNQALDLAVEDAKAKAERVADKLGAKIVGVYRISVMDGGRGAVAYDSRMEGAYTKEMAAAPAAPVFGGTSDYTAMVSVTFELK